MKKIKVSNLFNKNLLPDEVLTEISMASEMRARGFQEILCYQGRQIAASLGGYWKDQGANEFVVTSYGSRFLQWNGDTLEKSRPARLLVKSINSGVISDASAAIDKALGDFKFISAGCLAFIPDCISRDGKSAEIPLPIIFPMEVCHLQTHLQDRLRTFIEERSIQLTVAID